MIPFLTGDLALAIPTSIIIMVVLLSVIGSVAAVVAEVDVKKKVLELTATGLLLSALTFLVGKLTAILTTSMNIR
jgi:VIT1/CCC1 family predicted Fe2+/Mn2+ transporter